MSFLSSDAMGDKPVQFIVETQLLLTPFLKGRERTHLLYKVCRAETPEALHNDFRSIAVPETRSFEQVQDDALESMKLFLAANSDVNRQHEELKGATRLWKAAEQGHDKAVCKILQHPDTNPNMVRKDTCTTPLYIASYYGHEEVVKLILGHPRVQINLGKTDTAVSPLVAAAEEGREGIVRALVTASGVDVNQLTAEGVTCLCRACANGHEGIVEVLLASDSINASQHTTDGETALSIAARHGHVKIVENIAAHLKSRGPNPLTARSVNIPARHAFDSDVSCNEAVLAWAQEEGGGGGSGPRSFKFKAATLRSGSVARNPFHNGE
jgi:ankyrin repeat protein